MVGLECAVADPYQRSGEMASTAERRVWGSASVSRQFKFQVEVSGATSEGLGSEIALNMAMPRVTRADERKMAVRHTALA